MASLSDLSLRDRIWYHRHSFRRVEPLVPSLEYLRLALDDDTCDCDPGSPPTPPGRRRGARATTFSS
jgi:hypothetical protein